MKSNASSAATTEKPPATVELGDPKVEEFKAADGGLHAWLIVVASFLINGIIFGIHNCYGVLYLWLKKELEDNNVQDAATKCSLVGSLSIGMTFFTSPLAGILIDTFGLRKTAILGGAIATIGMVASSFALGHVEALYVTYGVLFGAGTSLTYNPSLVILGHYFQKRLGFVNGLVTTGSSIFTIALPLILDSVLHSFGLATTLQIMGGVMGALMICSITFVPKLPPAIKSTPVVGDSEGSRLRSYLRRAVNVSIWKNKKYVIWAVSVPLSMFGYFVPYVHLVAYVKDTLPEADGKLLVLCIGITSGIGRLVFGKIADMPKVNRIVLQQVALASIGVLTMFLTLANSFTWLIVICLGMGIFDGCFVALVGPIAFDLCGTKSASQAIGFLLGLDSIPTTSGPPIAGAIYDALGSYQIAFLIAGCPPIAGALLMCLINCIKWKPDEENQLAVDEEAIKQKITTKNELAATANADLAADTYLPVYTAAPQTGNPDARNNNRPVLPAKSGRFEIRAAREEAFPYVNNYGNSQVQLTGYSTNVSAILW